MERSENCLLGHPKLEALWKMIRNKDQRFGLHYHGPTPHDIIILPPYQKKPFSRVTQWGSWLG
jgi:hypothetical protein